MKDTTPEELKIHNFKYFYRHLQNKIETNRQKKKIIQKQKFSMFKQSLKYFYTPKFDTLFFEKKVQILAKCQTWEVSKILYLTSSQ